MKNIVIIKQSSSVQLGHLYEHLFIHSVNKFFYEKGLFKSVDYGVSGTVYENGLIVIDLSTYNDKAYLLLDEVCALRIDFQSSDDMIIRSLCQISAEESYRLCIPDSTKLVPALMVLDEKRWDNLDSINSINTRSMRRQNKPIFLTNDISPTPRIAKTTLVIDKTFFNNNSDLLPLFVLLSRLLLFTITNNIAEQFGLYSGDIYTRRQGEEVTSELLVARVSELSSLNVEDVRDCARQTIRHMLATDMFTRVQADLSSTSYLDRSCEAPDYELFAKGTGIIVGPSGWKEIATTENMEKITNNMRLEISLGRQKTSPEKILA